MALGFLIKAFTCALFDDTLKREKFQEIYRRGQCSSRCPGCDVYHPMEYLVWKLYRLI